MKTKKIPITRDFNLSNIVSKLDNLTVSTLGGADKPSTSVISKPEPAPTKARKQHAVGYVEIPKSEWKTLPKDTFIRYYDQEGNWRPGGKVRHFTETGILIGKFNHAKKVFTAWEVKFDLIKQLFRYDPDLAKPKSGGAPAKVVSRVPDSTLSSDEVKPEEVDDIVPALSNDVGAFSELGKKILNQDYEELESRVSQIEIDLEELHKGIKQVHILTKNLYKILQKNGVIQFV